MRQPWPTLLGSNPEPDRWMPERGQRKRAQHLIPRSIELAYFMCEVVSPLIALVVKNYDIDNLRARRTDDPYVGSLNLAAPAAFGSTMDYDPVRLLSWYQQLDDLALMNEGEHCTHCDWLFLNESHGRFSRSGYGSQIVDLLCVP